MSSRPLLLALLLALIAAPLAGCGEEPSPDPREPGVAPERIEHVHGLGVDGDSLYIATHHGLWRASGDRPAVRVDGPRHDLMGFTVADGRFLASGHPAPDATGLPPYLGLVASHDEGASWEMVSLAGEVDFHVLRVAGRSVYGIDSASGRLLASRDGGRSWQRHDPPPGTFDLAVAPGDSDRLLAATAEGLAESRDGGATWRPRSARPTGLLAWPAPERLLLLDARGRVWRSADGGERFSTTGRLEGDPEAFTAHGGEAYAAVSGGRVLASPDGGRSWSLRAGG